MNYQNIAVQVSNYATNALNEELNKYGQRGFKLVNTILAKNKYGIDVMYLFFTKEIDQLTEKGGEQR